MVPFSFACAGAGSSTGYKTSTHRARAASAGPSLGSLFHLLVVLSTIANSRPPSWFIPQQAVGAPVHPSPPPSGLFVPHSAPVSGPVRSPSHTIAAPWPPATAITSLGTAVVNSVPFSDNALRCFHHPGLCSDPFRPTPFTMPYPNCSLSHFSGPFFVQN
ncbi:hypothetical protein V8E53_009363 [Lactarius tabidus]